MQSILTQYNEKPIVIGGDQNTYLNPELDKCGGIREVQSESSKAIEDLCDQFCLFEVYRFLFPKKRQYTWRNKGRPTLIQSRLDMFLVSQDFQYLSPKCSITPGIISDHSLVQYGPGVGVFGNSMHNY